MPFEPFNQPDDWNLPEVYEAEYDEDIITRWPPIVPDPKKVWYKRWTLWLLLIVCIVLYCFDLLGFAIVLTIMTLYFFWAFVSGLETS